MTSVLVSREKFGHRGSLGEHHLTTDADWSDSCTPGNISDRGKKEFAPGSRRGCDTLISDIWPLGL